MTMKLEDQILLVVGETTRNGRLYTSDAAEQMALIADRGILTGEYLGDGNTTVNLANVSHTVSNIRVRDGNVIGDIKFLDTPMGLVLQQMILTQMQPKFFTRGSGKVDESGIISEFVPISVDVTFGPVSHEK